MKILGENGAMDVASSPVLCYRPLIFFSPRIPPAMSPSLHAQEGLARGDRVTEKKTTFFRTRMSQPNLDGSWGPSLSSGLPLPTQAHPRAIVALTGSWEEGAQKERGPLAQD